MHTEPCRLPLCGHHLCRALADYQATQTQGVPKETNFKLKSKNLLKKSNTKPALWQTCRVPAGGTAPNSTLGDAGGPQPRTVAAMRADWGTSSSAPAQCSRQIHAATPGAQLASLRPLGSTYGPTSHPLSAASGPQKYTPLSQVASAGTGRQSQQYHAKNTNNTARTPKPKLQLEA